MSDEQQIWEAACEKVGVWKGGERCQQKDGFIEDRSRGQARCPYCSWNTPLSSAYQRAHDIPAPAIGDAEATLKMEQWIVAKGLVVCIGPKWVIIYGKHGVNLAEADTQDSIPLALAAAVLEVRQ